MYWSGWWWRETWIPEPATCDHRSGCVRWDWSQRALSSRSWSALRYSRSTANPWLAKKAAASAGWSGPNAGAPASAGENVVGPAPAAAPAGERCPARAARRRIFRGGEGR